MKKAKNLISRLGLGLLLVLITMVVFSFINLPKSLAASSPSPSITANNGTSSFNLNPGESKYIPISIKNNGGLANKFYVDFSFSDGLEVISCEPVGWVRYNKRDIIWNNNAQTMFAQNLLYSFEGNQFIASSTRNFGIKVQAKNNISGNQWIKYRTALNPYGVNPIATSVYDTFRRDPSWSIDQDQQGWFVKKISVTINQTNLSGSTNINNTISLPSFLPSKPIVSFPSPGLNVTSDDVTITWNGQSQIDYYYFQLYEGVYENGKQAVVSDWPRQNNYIIPSYKLQPNKEYQYWIWAHNALGFSEPVAGIFSYKRANQSSQSIIHIPSQEQTINNITPKLDWDDIAGSQYYYLQIYDGVYQSGKQAILHDWPATSHYYVPEGKLQFGKTYQVWMWSYNGSSWTSPILQEFKVVSLALSNKRETKIFDLQNMTSKPFILQDGEIVGNSRINTYPESFNSFKVTIKNLGYQAENLSLSLEGVKNPGFFEIPNSNFNQENIFYQNDLKLNLKTQQETNIYFKFNLENNASGLHDVKLIIKDQNGNIVNTQTIGFFIQTYADFIKDQGIIVLNGMWDFLFGHWYDAFNINSEANDLEKKLALIFVFADVATFGQDKIVISLLDHTGISISKNILVRELDEKMLSSTTSTVQKELIEKFVLNVEGKQLAKYVGEDIAKELMEGFSKNQQTRNEVMGYLKNIFSSKNFQGTISENSIRGFFSHLNDFKEVDGASRLLKRLSEQIGNLDNIKAIFREAEAISDMKRIHGYEILQVSVKEGSKEIADVIARKNGQLSIHEIKNTLLAMDDIDQVVREFKLANSLQASELVIWNNYTKSGTEIKQEVINKLIEELNKTGIRYEIKISHSYDGVFYSLATIVSIDFLFDTNVNKTTINYNASNNNLILDSLNQTFEGVENNITGNQVAIQPVNAPLFSSSFGNTPWISANSYHKGQAGWYPEISVKFDQPVSKIKLHYLLRNGWYKPTGFKIVDIFSGKELAKRENSFEMFDKTEEIEFSQFSSNFKFVPSNLNGDYTVFYAKDSLAYLVPVSEKESTSTFTDQTTDSIQRGEYATEGAEIIWHPGNNISSGTIKEIGGIVPTAEWKVVPFNIDIYRNDQKVYSGVSSGKYSSPSNSIKPDVSFRSSDQIKFVIQKGYHLYVSKQNNPFFESNTKSENDPYFKVVYEGIVQEKDTIPPIVPTITFNSPTNQVAQKITGTKEKDSSVWLTYNNIINILPNDKEIVPIDNSETWSYELPISTEGSNKYTFYSKDKAGNRSKDTNVEIIRDTQGPEINITPLAGTYSEKQNVVLDTNEKAVIYYTVDGSDPNINPSIYKSPISIDKDTTLRILAKDSLGNISKPRTEKYIIKINQDPGTIYTDSAYTSQAQSTATSATVIWHPKNQFDNGVISEIGEILSAVYSGNPSYNIVIYKNDQKVYSGQVTGRYPWTTTLKPDIFYSKNDVIKFIISSSSRFYITGQNIAWFESSTGNDPYFAVKYKSVANAETINLLDKPWQEYNNGKKITWSKTADGQLEITDSPSAANGSKNEWLYDLDRSRVNQFQWMMDIPEKATVEAKISWDSPDSNYGGLLLGGIGFIDKNSYLNDFVGIDDGSGTKGNYGFLGAITRDYITQSGYSGESWNKAEVLSNSSGSAALKMIRNGKHVKLFVNNNLIKEHNIQGEIVGIALGTNGHLYFPFGTLKVEKLELK